ncbi:hypothetical protein HSBAA_13000 [Vreelandella sulfidaeris]|uniref:Uncharacterized protein n=1 Tax=Vreelandella sulfidaeris TaxID=115553 RepID=A0A455U9J5_9GAMM|nr:hypothetical protein HSBAA_13000 [Halomonas sulfidaeris]
MEAFKTARWRDTDWLKQDLARFAEQYPDGDPRAVVSIWSKWHFSALTVPALTANLLLNRDLPMGLDDLQVIFNEKAPRRGYGCSTKAQR